jgi:tetratricopeptide (TPR) repeat protein
MAQEQVKSQQAAELTKKKSSKTNGAAGRARADSLGGDDDVVLQRRPTSFARFLRDVIIISVLLGGGMFAYRKHIVTKEKVGTLATQAIDKLAKDDLVSLKAAEDIYKEIVALDGDNDRGLLGLAETYFWQSRQGLSTRDQAEQYLRRAVQEKSERPERYAVQAYLQITSGASAQAAHDIKDQLDKGMGSSKLAHAYGWSLLEQGNYVEANRVVRTALDTEFTGVRYALTLAEIAHRQGEERAAVRNLRRILEPSMNPGHEIALAWSAALALKTYGNITGPAKNIQDVKAKMDKIGPRAQALLIWAEGELALAVGNAQGAEKNADDAIAKIKDYPPFHDLKARALLAQKKYKEGIAIYEQAIALKPEYRGIKKELILLKSDHKDDSALAMIDELEKDSPASPEFLIMRGEHYLKKGDLEKAKAAFTDAADKGDDAAILFGLAKVTFQEEKKKNNKADLDRVATAFQTTLEKKPSYPECQEYMAQISLWNYNVEGASKELEEAEQAYKKKNVSVMQMVEFFDRAVDTFKTMEAKQGKAAADKAAADWKKKKEEYLASVVTAEAQ